MILHKALSVFLAVCMVLSSVSVSFAEEIPTPVEKIENIREIVEQEKEKVKTEAITERTGLDDTEENAGTTEKGTVITEATTSEDASEDQSETETKNVGKEAEDIVLTAELDDIIVTLMTDVDAFDNKGELSLSVTPVEITDEEEKKLDGKETENVAKRVTYDITVLDDNEEIEPVKEVTVSFELKDAPSGADGVNIYHHDGTDIENVFHEVLNENPATEASIGSDEDPSVANTQDADEVSEEELEGYDDVVIIDDVTVDSFSYYTIDFTYKDKTVSINGDTTANKLDDIVAQLGITEKVEEAETYQTADCTGEDTDGEIKNAEGDTLFTVYESGDTWYVDAENAFQTEHGLVVKTADGAEYKIKVTDTSSCNWAELTANTTSITLDDDAMTPDTAISYAKSKSIANTSYVVYKKAEEDKYNVIIGSGDIWDASNPQTFTLSDLKNAMGSFKVYVIGTTTELPTYTWTSVSSKNNSIFTFTDESMTQATAEAIIGMEITSASQGDNVLYAKDGVNYVTLMYYSGAWEKNTYALSGVLNTLNDNKLYIIGTAATPVVTQITSNTTAITPNDTVTYVYDALGVAKNNPSLSSVMGEGFLAYKKTGDKYTGILCTEGEWTDSTSDKTLAELKSMTNAYVIGTVTEADSVCKIGNKGYSTVQAAVNEAASGQTILMIANSNENVTVTAGKNITIDLNGYVLKGTGSKRVIYVNGESSENAGDAGILTISDSNKDRAHYFKYSNSNAWELNDEADESAKNAAIKVNEITNSTKNGTLIKVTGGVITGGKISGEGNVGGGVYINSKCKLTMTGGNICGNTAYEGGGLYIPANTTVKLEDVAIIGNYAESGYGGMLFNASGGKHFTIGGKITICGNLADSKKDNLLLWDISSGAPLKIDTDHTLSEGSKIHLAIGSLPNTGPITTNGSADDVQYFFSDKEDYAVTFETDHLELVNAYTITCTTPTNGTLSADKTSAAPGDKITLTASPSEGYVLDTLTATDAGENPVSITGNSFTMPAANVTVSATFIAAKDISTCTIASIGDQTYTGSAITPEPTVTDGSTTLTKDIDYTVEYVNNTNAGTATVKIAGIGKYLGNKSTTFNITKKQLTVKAGCGPVADGKTYDGTTTATVSSVGTIEGIASGDTSKVSVTATGTFDNKNVGNNKTVTVVYSLTGDKANNYIKPDDNSAIADIDRRQLTVTGTTADKIYDGNTTVTVTVGTVNGIVEGDDVTVTAATTDTFDSKNVGTSKNVTVTYSQSGNDENNYDKPINEMVAAAITAKAINVTADSKTSKTGADLVTLTYTADDLISGDSFAGGLATNADKAKAGTYEITQGTLTAGDNYNINFTKGIYTITESKTDITPKSSGSSSGTWTSVPTAYGSSTAPINNGTWGGSITGTWQYKVNGETLKNATAWISYTGADGKPYTGCYYFDKNGNMATDWQKIDNIWYFFDTTPGSTLGMMKTSGWITTDGKQYYVGADGKMLASTTAPDGHEVDATGARID